MKIQSLSADIIDDQQAVQLYVDFESGFTIEVRLSIDDILREHRLREAVREAIMRLLGAPQNG